MRHDRAAVNQQEVDLRRIMANKRTRGTALLTCLLGIQITAVANGSLIRAENFCREACAR